MTEREYSDHPVSVVIDIVGVVVVVVGVVNFSTLATSLD